MSSPTQAPIIAKSVLDELPPLTTTPLSSKEDLKESLHLTTDSIAQQRQIASSSTILSHLFLTLWTILIAVLIKTYYHTLSDIGIIATTGSGITMALLLIVRWSCDGYVAAAEAVAAQDLAWFDQQKGDGEVVVLGTRYGEELIGTLVMRVPSKDAKSKSAFFEGIPKVEIVAWTVGLRFRHKGIGRGLLEEAVKLARERCGKDVKITFAKEHVNSKIVLMGPFQGSFKRREEKARRMLEDVAREVGADDVSDLLE